MALINAVITNKENTLITEFPKDYITIYEELCSIGCRKALERIPLTDNEEDDIRVKLYADSNIGNHLLCLFSEENTLADVNTACSMIEKSDESIKEELEQNLLNDQYSSTIDLVRDIKNMTEQLGQVKTENSYADWNIGDTCVMIVNIPKRYTQEFEVKGFDGKYYTLKRGNSIHHA